ncbi:hypothetical protein Hokovirus_5_23 [Hokovirus HKV1]|uniref:Uncharacterized protein n=1 Tax=Hokovirus HKV1 TaxID=1977638 RepID=A0A1V0SHJ4_9VIRU|nr:hypothetical protein Hokovirus_5_23 [Hokovirus HKV1]
MINIGIKNNNIVSKYKEIYIINNNNEIDINSIIDQIQEFRKSQKEFICEFCKSLDNIQVDHGSFIFRHKKKFYFTIQRKYT